MRKHILFDLDGTLTDPAPGITRSISYALKFYGREVEPESLHWCIGPPLRGSLAKLLEAEDIGLVEDALAKYRERFVDIGLYENSVYVGIPEAIQALVGEGYHLHVATSKPWVFAERILDHFGLAPFFSSVSGSELDGTRDAKAEVIAHSLNLNGIEPNLALMIGDREHDVIGAAHHGIPCLGVLYGYGGVEELRDAASLCESPANLLHSIRQLAATK